MRVCACACARARAKTTRERVNTGFTKLKNKLSKGFTKLTCRCVRVRSGSSHGGSNRWAPAAQSSYDAWSVNTPRWTQTASSSNFLVETPRAPCQTMPDHAGLCQTAVASRAYMPTLMPHCAAADHAGPCRTVLDQGEQVRRGCTGGLPSEAAPASGQLS